MKKIIRFLLICSLSISLTGCLHMLIIQKTTVSPDSLPDAKLGQSYYAKIEISGGVGPVPFFPLKDFRPENSGLTIDVCEPDPNSCLIVQGIPVVKGAIVIEIGGFSIGGGGRGRFGKIYTINVSE